MPRHIIFQSYRIRRQLEPDLSSEDVRRHASRGAVSAFGRHAAVRLLAFMGTLALARLLVPAQFGLFVTAQFLLTVLQGLAIGGVIAALTRRQEKVSEKDYQTALGLQLLAALVLITATFFAAPYVAEAYDLSPQNAWIFRIISLAIIPMALKSIPQTRLQRSLRHDKVAGSEVAEYLVYVVFAVGLALWGYGVWALVAATLLRYIVGAAILHRAAHQNVRFGFQKAKMRELLATAGPLQGAIALDLANRAILPVLIGSLIGLAAVGHVGMALTFVEAVILQPLALLANLQLRLFARVQADASQMRALLSDFYSAGSMVIFPIAAGLAITAPKILPIVLSSTWQDVGPLTSGLALATALQVISMPTVQAAKALGYVHALLLLAIANLMVQIALLFCLTPTFGAFAYVISTGATVALTTIVTLGRVRRTIGWPPLRVIVPGFASSAIAALVWYGALKIESAPVLAILGLLVGCLVYCLVLILLGGRSVARLLLFASKGLPPSLSVFGDLAERTALSCERFQLTQIFERRS